MRDKKPMSIGQRIATINEIRESIQFISKKWGGDDPEWLEAYMDDVLTASKDNLEQLLFAVRDMKETTRLIK